MSYNFQDILRQALSGGLGQADYTDPTGQRSQETWIDPATGLTVMRDGNGYRFVQPGEGGMNTAYDMGADGSVGDARQYKTAGLGSQLGEFTREGAIPLALAALGANGIGNMLGQANGFGAAGGGMGAGADAADMAFGGGNGVLGGGSGLPEISFGQWSPTPDYGAHFIDGAADAGGYAGTSLSGTTGGLTPATLEGSLGTAGYGTAGASGGASLGIPGVLNGAGAALPFAGATDLLGSLGGLGSLAKFAAPLLGAAAGAKGTPGGATSQTRSLDPRLDAIAFGPGGLLSNAQEWLQKNKSGQNDVMKQASQQLTGLLTDPNLKTAIYSQGATGQRLLNQPMAGNPFTRAGFNGTNWWGG